MKNFDIIDKDAIVGTKNRKIFLINPPLPSNINKTSSDNKLPSIIIKNNKPKRKGCSGCGRKRG